MPSDHEKDERRFHKERFSVSRPEQVIQCMNNEKAVEKAREYE